MTEHPHRHDVWGDDPEEVDASAVVEELLADPGTARRWHDHPSIVWTKAVGRFIGRNGKRVTVHRAEVEAAVLRIHHRHHDDDTGGKARDDKREGDDDQPPNETHQSVIAMARSAWRSRAESFSVSDFSWPQAARMSRPRGVRTGDE